MCVFKGRRAQALGRHLSSTATAGMLERGLETRFFNEGSHGACCSWQEFSFLFLVKLQHLWRAQPLVSLSSPLCIDLVRMLSLAASIDAVSRIRPRGPNSTIRLSPPWMVQVASGAGGGKCYFFSTDGTRTLGGPCQGTPPGWIPFCTGRLSFGAASCGCRLQCTVFAARTQMRGLCVSKPQTIQPVLEYGPRGRSKPWQLLLEAWEQ